MTKEKTPDVLDSLLARGNYVALRQAAQKVLVDAASPDALKARARERIRQIQMDPGVFAAGLVGVLAATLATIMTAN